MDDRLEHRIDNLETRVRILETQVAVTKTNFDNIIEKLERIDLHQNRLFWLLTTAIIGGVVNVLFQAGIIP